MKNFEISDFDRSKIQPPLYVSCCPGHIGGGNTIKRYIKSISRMVGKCKIYRLKGSENAINDKYDRDGIIKLNADWLVYYYKSGDYEGSGFAIWKSGNDWFYNTLNHCSCYGPTEELYQAIPYNNFAQIQEISKHYKDENSDDVIDFINQERLI